MKPYRPDTFRQEDILYENALSLAQHLTLEKGQRAGGNIIVSGAFIFGDFIEALHHAPHGQSKRMTISTLSLSQENIDSLQNLPDNGYLDHLDLIISAYLPPTSDTASYPTLYEHLDHQNRFPAPSAEHT